MCVARVMAAEGVKAGERRRYEADMESRVLALGLKEGRQELAAKWRAWRRGWYVGAESFGEQLKRRLGGLVAGKRRESPSGGAKQARGEAAAPGLLAAGLRLLGLRAGELRQMRRQTPEKTALAWWLRQRTAVSLRWVGEALSLGRCTRVTPAVSRMQRRPGRRLERLKQRLLESGKQKP